MNNVETLRDLFQNTSKTVKPIMNLWHRSQLSQLSLSQLPKNTSNITVSGAAHWPAMELEGVKSDDWMRIYG